MLSNVTIKLQFKSFTWPDYTRSGYSAVWTIQYLQIYTFFFFTFQLLPWNKSLLHLNSATFWQEGGGCNVLLLEAGTLKDIQALFVGSRFKGVLYIIQLLPTLDSGPQCGSGNTGASSSQAVLAVLWCEELFVPTHAVTCCLSWAVYSTGKSLRLCLCQLLNECTYVYWLSLTSAPWVHCL